MHQHNHRSPENHTTDNLQDSRPKLREGLRFIPNIRANGEPWFRIEDPLMRRFHRIGLAEYEFLLCLDGTHTLDESRQASAAASKQRRVLTTEQAEAFVIWAASQSLLEGHQQSAPENKSKIQGSLAWMKVPLFHRETNWQPLVRTLSPLFSRSGIAGAVCLWLLAISMVMIDSDRFLRDIASIFQPGAWLTLTCVWVMLKVLHEAGHLVCCHRYGGRVEEAGVAWMLIAPVAYVDLTDIYRIPVRRHRLMTCLAGIYVELTLAAVAIVFWWNSTSPTWNHFFTTTALTASIASLLFNLNPLMRLDGYHAVCDLLDRPNLGSEGTKAFQRLASLLFLGKRHAHEPVHALLSTYGCLTWVYRFVIAFCVASATYAMYGRIAAAVIIFVLLTSAVPAMLNLIKIVSRECKQRPAVSIRMAAISMCVVFVGASGFQLYRSTQTGWYGIVEYEDDSPVRCVSPGRVVRVLFKSGDNVVQGQPILELENLSVHADLIAAECELQLGESRWNRYRELHLAAEAASAKTANHALTTRVEQLKRQEQSLLIRAPRDGKVIAMEPENWVGQWFEEGEPLLYVVDETKKKVIVAIPQSDLAKVAETKGSKVLVVVEQGKKVEAIVRTITRQAELTSPHPAMTTVAGGRLAVRTHDKDDAVVLITPHLQLEATFADPENSLRTGQAIRTVSLLPHHRTSIDLRKR